MVLDAGAQMLHYDVMDGHFVPNISFGVPVLKSLHKNLPDAFYDVHLMISHPLQYAEAFIKAGATLYNFHLQPELWQGSRHLCRIKSGKGRLCSNDGCGSAGPALAAAGNAGAAALRRI